MYLCISLQEGRRWLSAGQTHSSNAGVRNCLLTKVWQLLLYEVLKCLWPQKFPQGCARLPPLVLTKVDSFGHTPSGMAVQLVEDRVVTVLEHEVQLPFSPKNLDEIHQVGVFQLLHRYKAKDKQQLKEKLDKSTFKSILQYSRLCRLISSNQL